MEIVVVLRREFVEPFLAANGSLPAVQELHASLTSLGIVIESMHPGTRDPSLAAYFLILKGRSSHDSQVIVDRLRRCAAVDGAYIKPAGESPG